MGVGVGVGVWGWAKSRGTSNCVDAESRVPSVKVTISVAVCIP